MTANIRKYRPSDFNACKDLWAELTQFHRDIYHDPTIGGDDPGQPIEAYLKNEGLAGPWVAELDEEVAGFTGLLLHGEEAEIEPLVVRSTHRSRGIGRLLLGRAMQEAKKAGVRFLSVRPVARNVAAIAFFADAGFDRIGHIDLFQDISAASPRTWKTGIRIHGKEFRYWRSGEDGGSDDQRTDKGQLPVRESPLRILWAHPLLQLLPLFAM